MRRAILSTSTVLLGLCSVLKHHVVDAYPILIDVNGKGRNTCLTLEIPDDDDVHMVFSSLPEKVDPEIESWIMSEMSSITDHESNNFLKMHSTPPPEIYSLMEKSGYHAMIDVTITGPFGAPRRQRLVPFKINVLKNVAKDTKAGRRPRHDDDDDWSPNTGSYSICMSLHQRISGAHAVFEHLLVSEFEDKMRTRHVLKKEHLTPIDMAFEEGIVAARTILNEMSMLEKRENRMKHTSDSTNKRILTFSYVSIVVLLGVTWLQISYLKVYFKKKKVL